MRGLAHTGLNTFVQKFNPRSLFLVGSEGFSKEEFLKIPLHDLI